jgi:hypothetical protein
MNKETRMFIWGIILTIICGLATVIHIIEIKENIPQNWLDWVGMVFCICGLYSGIEYIHQSIK